MALSLSVAFPFNYTRTVGTTASVVTPNISVKVYPLFYNTVIVEWSIPSTWGNCSFNVYRADTEVGALTKITDTPLVNTNFLSDVLTQDFSIFHKSWYVVEVQLPSPDNRFIKSEMYSWENVRGNLMQIRANEITRRERILLNKFVGIDSLIFRRKYFGPRCPDCYNASIEKVTKDHCTSCLGTSFLGGYFPGISTKICYEISPNSTENTYVGKLETNRTSAWTISSPSVMSQDLVLRLPDFRLFKVEGVNSTELQTVSLRQSMQIVEKDKTSIEMNLINQILPSRYLTANTTATDTLNTQVGYSI